MDAEVLQVAQALPDFFAAAADRTAFNGVEYLGRMEAEHGGVPEAGRTYAVPEHTEAVSCVVNDRETVLFGDCPDAVDVAKVAVNVHRQDGDGFFGDQRFQLFWIQGVGHRVYVAEHRRAAAAHNGVRGGRKGEGRGDNFAVQVKGFNHVFQRQMPVGEQRQFPAAQKALQLRFEFAVLDAHVGQPVAVPEFTDFITVLLK